MAKSVVKPYIFCATKFGSIYPKSAPTAWFYIFVWIFCAKKFNGTTCLLHMVWFGFRLASNEGVLYLSPYNCQKLSWLRFSCRKWCLWSLMESWMDCSEVLFRWIHYCGAGTLFEPLYISSRLSFGVTLGCAAAMCGLSMRTLILIFLLLLSYEFLSEILRKVIIYFMIFYLLHFFIQNCVSSFWWFFLVFLYAPCFFLLWRNQT